MKIIVNADEPAQHYREIRVLLEKLVASWPWDRPGTAFENAKVHVYFHCEDCGTKLSVNDLAVVLELEMLRLGTVDTRKVPFYVPICVRCYIRRTGPECRSVANVVDWAGGIDASRLPDMRALGHAAPRTLVDNSRALALRSSAGTSDEHPMLLEASRRQTLIQDTVSGKQTPSQPAWWRQHASVCLLIAAVLLIALALSMALIRFPPHVHASTLTHPTIRRRWLPPHRVSGLEASLLPANLACAAISHAAGTLRDSTAA